MKLLAIILPLLFTLNTLAQCPTSGTISSNCTTTGDMNITGGSLTVNSGVIVTVTGTLRVRGGATLTGTGATFNVGGLADAYGGTNTITGGTFNTGSFDTGGGGNFTMSGATVAISPETDVSIAGATITISNSTFTGVQNWSNNVSSMSLTNTDITASQDIEFEDATITGGTFTAGVSSSFASGNVTFNGSTLDIGGDNVGTTGTEAWSFNGGAVVTFNNNSQVDVRGDVNGGNGADLFIDDSDVRITGNFDNVGNGTVEVRNNGTLSVGGNFDNSGGGNVSSDSGGLIDVDGDYNNSGGGNTDVNGGAIVVGGTYSGGSPTGDGGSCDGGGGGCCGTGCSTLPVTLINFSGSVEDHSVQLKWQTASELNNDFFTLEVSNDGYSFKEIATIAGNGTVNEVKQYSFTTNLGANTGSIYYRLSQTDFDGTHEILKIIYLDTQSITESVKIYPNPVSTNVISLSGTFTSKNWKIYTLAGDKVSEGTLEGNNQVDVSNLVRGFYILSVESVQGTIQKRFVVK